MPNRELIERDMDDYVEGESWPEAESDLDDSGPIPPADPTAVSGIIRRIKRLDRDRAEINEVTDTEIRRLEGFRADRIAGIDREIAWGERAVEAFMRQYTAVTHKKSLRLADGTPALRKPSTKVVVVDERAFLAFAIGIVSPEELTSPTVVPVHPELLRAKYSLIADEARALTQRPALDSTVDETIARTVVALPDGTVVPGVEIHTPKQDTFNLTLGAD